MVSDTKESEEDAKRADLEIRGGSKTINERRSELGLPLLDTPAADQPILVAGNGVYLFSPDGIVNAQTASAGTDAVAEDVDPMQSTNPSPDTNPMAVKPNDGNDANDAKLPPAEPEKEAEYHKAGVPNEFTAAEGLARLAQLPNPAGSISASDDDADDYVESPWPVIDGAIKDEGYPVDPDVWSKAQLTLITLKDLFSTDTMLNREKVADRIEALGQSLKPYRNYPLVYDDGEKQIIIDGHHRLMAMMLLGMDQAAVWLGKPDSEKEARKEIDAFLHWTSRKWERTRKFEFKAVDPIVGEALNRCYFEGDMETLKSLAKAYIK
jgi:hypothetical protein